MHGNIDPLKPSEQRRTILGIAAECDGAVLSLVGGIARVRPSFEGREACINGVARRWESHGAMSSDGANKGENEGTGEPHADAAMATGFLSDPEMIF